MIVSLIERTRVNGILKALSMKSGTALAIFSNKAIIVGFIGAVFGIGLDGMLANVAARIFTRDFAGETGQEPVSGSFVIRPVLAPTVMLGAFGFGTAVSVIFKISSLFVVLIFISPDHCI